MNSVEHYVKRSAKHTKTLTRFQNGFKMVDACYKRLP